MLNWNTLVDVVTILLLGVGGYLLFLIRMGTEAAVKTTAEETAKATIEQLQWPAELGRELQKTRGVERQTLRYQSYGVLWKELRPLAIYDEAIINRKTVGDLSKQLSNWYFSESGGLLLTPQARDFYFALQDLLRTTAKFPEDWDADRAEASEGDQMSVFRDVLKERGVVGAINVLDYLSTGVFDDWQDRAAGLAKEWRKGVNEVAAVWAELDKKQRFATLQQAGSKLRTSLANDLESRVR